MARILVTPRSLTAGRLDEVAALKPLLQRGWELVSGPAGRMPSEEELIGLLPGIDGWIAGVETVSATALKSADRLRVISRNGVGADAIDADQAAAQAIEIVLARGANSRGVAELAFGHMLSALRDIPAANAALHKGEWERTLGREMADRTVGIVGFGAIGRLVSGMAEAFGARVLAFDPFAPPAPGDYAETSSFADLFASADIVTLHSPPPEDGTPLVSGALLDTVRPGTILVNTARSALVDDEAVRVALDNGTLSAYAVDAFAAEPPELTDLLRHPRTVMTPHLGGYTDASIRRATELAVLNLIAILDR
ncbi:NAD(P)-dependent oxidoreductase [Glaciihabitans sp. UYNi722]|uniref:NAD(P)-dependent oxidoreductase n=1 Tax=Glaciihabitans sp. UYNi722 TaxID=3156344 RepID=UPI003391908A